MAVNLETQGKIWAKHQMNTELRSKYPVWIITPGEAARLGQEVLIMAAGPAPRGELEQAGWRHDLSTSAAYALEHGDLTQFNPTEISRLRTMASEYAASAKAYLPAKIASPEGGAMTSILKRLVGPQKEVKTHL